MPSVKRAEKRRETAAPSRHFASASNEILTTDNILDFSERCLINNKRTAKTGYRGNESKVAPLFCFLSREPNRATSCCQVMVTETDSKSGRRTAQHTFEKRSGCCRDFSLLASRHSTEKPANETLKEKVLMNAGKAKAHDERKPHLRPILSRDLLSTIRFHGCRYRRHL